MLNARRRIQIVYCTMRGLKVNLIFLIIVMEHRSICACPDEPIADTQTGKVRGVKQTTVEGDEFCSFRGIPYAKPPIGELRFKDAEAAEPWTDVRQATAYGPDCAQHNILTNQISGVEDCLYLNVFTKSLGSKDRKPVMFWIHGGFFLFGSSDDAVYGPDYLMRKDIVLVTVNYRLGVFGFLNLDNELASGNQGLKDQLMALHWVHDNIAYFGGDPNSLTIFGQSAGGASVHYLSMSPLASNLFHRAISQSGTALIPWAFQPNPKDRAFELCEHLGHTNKDPKSAVEFLKTIDTKTLMKAQKQMLSKDEKIQFAFRFGPSIDLQSKNPLLPVHPEIAATKGIQIPLIIGYNDREGIICYKNIATSTNRFNTEFNHLMHPSTDNRMKKYGLTLDDLKRIYFPNGPLKRENIDELIELLGDVLFVEGIHEVVKIQVEKSSAPTYLYKFTYDKEPSILKIIFNAKISGACHADDLFFLFKSKMLEGKLKYPEKGSEQYKIMEQMVDMWTNFATTGVPVEPSSELIPLHWQPVDNQTAFRCLNICENLHMENVSSLELKYTVH